MERTATWNFSKTRIKNRLLKKAAELWGYQESEMDAFDPLVNFLLEACSVEFEKLYGEISNVQSRVMERLSNVLIPEVTDVVKPAHGVLQVRSHQPEELVNRNTQLVLGKNNASAFAAAKLKGREDAFFSPLCPVKVFNCAVQYIATTTSIYKIENGNQKIEIARSQELSVSDHQSLWIGITVDPAIKNLKELLFYFDWQNEPDKEQYYEFLPYSTWMINKHPVSFTVGLGENDKGHNSSADMLAQEFDVSYKTEQHIRHLYNNKFVQLAQDIKNFTTENYPELFNRIYREDNLRDIKEKLLWVEVQFPKTMAEHIINNIFCAVNAFPVLNRRLNQFSFRLQQQLNIVPLNSESSFLAVESVTTENGTIMHQLPLASTESLQSSTYTLRYQGVGRFDERDAKQLLQYLLDMLRDESVSFRSSGNDFLHGNIREFNQLIARLEEKVKPNDNSKQSLPYLMMKAKNGGESVYISFWTTFGEAANKIPSGTRLTLYNGSSLKENEIYLLTTTSGGKNKLSTNEKVNVFKKSLLYRNRIVTKEDIRNVCLTELGTHAKDVYINKKIKVGAGPDKGFIRCIDIEVVPSADNREDASWWKAVCKELETTLTLRSANNLPYEVRLKIE
jgi:hypothetical protein